MRIIDLRLSGLPAGYAQFWTLLAVLLGSGLRVSEALGLDRDQYTRMGFERVQIKGDGVRDFVPVHRDTRKVLDDWLEARKDAATLLFITLTGRRLPHREVAAIVQRIAAQANGQLSDEEKNRGIPTCAEACFPNMRQLQHKLEADLTRSLYLATAPGVAYWRKTDSQTQARHHVSR